MRRLTLIALAFVVFASACSSRSDQAETATETELVDQAGAAGTAAPPISSPAAFCEPAVAFFTSTAARFVTTPDAAVFDSLDVQLQLIEDQAPPAILNDVQVLRSGFASIDEAYASTGYEPAASFTLPTEVQQANFDAGQNLEDYLLDACELDRIRDAQIEQIAAAFGVEDLTTAECLHAQMGDIANIEPSELTPELMTTQICGTSILGLLSGESVDG